MQKISIIWQKWYLYSKYYCESCVRDFLVQLTVFARQKVTFYRLLVWNPTSTLLQTGQKLEKWQWRHNLPQFVILFFVFNGPRFRFHVNIITCSGVMAVFLRDWKKDIGDWKEIRKSEIPPFEFCAISGDWAELGIPYFARISLIKCSWMPQNARITVLTVSELLREMVT